MNGNARNKCLTILLAHYTLGPAPDTRPWTTTLKPHYLIVQLVLALFVGFNSVFVAFWALGYFDRRLWPIEKLAMISQFTSTLAQLWSIGPLLALAYVVQAIVSDKTLRHREYQPWTSRIAGASLVSCTS